MRWLELAMGAIAYFFALNDQISLVALLLSSYGIIAQFTPPLIAALYWKRATTPGVVSGLVAGSIVTLFFFQMSDLRPFDLHEGVLGLMVHIPVLFLVSLLTKDPAPEKAEAFLIAAKSGDDASATPTPASSEMAGGDHS
jgi:SSS family solute:Na+ symporter